MVNFKLNGIDLTVKKGTTILEAARAAKVEIPTLCYLKDLNEIGACRMCLVEVEGIDSLVTACNTQIEENMSIVTNSQRVKNARKMNLELILSKHNKVCYTCPRDNTCTLQKLANDFGIFENLFPETSTKKPWERNAVLVREESKCVKCMRCIAACDKLQDMNIWTVLGTGSRTTVGLEGNKKFSQTDCTHCGQCITHCPCGALSERDDIALAQNAIDDCETVTVVQVAPAVRAAWADGLIPSEKATVGRMVAALKRLGFNFVFDTNFSADLTIMEEASELIERFGNKENASFPMFTSCCPGWVSFVKSQFPQFTANLSTAKSPQQMFGAVTKSYFAEKMGIDPRKIRVVSIMPCVAKKSESAQAKHSDACGDRDVDIVLTTREFQRWIAQREINLSTLPEEEFDSPLGTGTGAAVIFGATGGVMDAALRTAHYFITGKNPDADAFTNVRGSEGIKKASFNIEGVGELKVAVASGLANARALMEDIASGKEQLDFVEVMACPGGCAGGGGQPIREGEELGAVRGNTLWSLDKEATQCWKVPSARSRF